MKLIFFILNLGNFVDIFFVWKRSDKINRYDSYILSELTWSAQRDAIFIPHNHHIESGISKGAKTDGNRSRYTYSILFFIFVAG